MIKNISPLQRMKNTFRRLDRRYLKGRVSLLQHASSWKEYWRILEVSEAPILIGGCGRSGTTLLLSLMSVHPNVYAFPEETEYFCPGVWQCGIEECRDEPFSIDLVYRHLCQEDVDTTTVGRWCEKTPMNVHFIDKIIRFFGNECRFVNIVRDGRDVVTSHHPHDKNNYWVSPDRWVRDVTAGKRWEDHPQVLTVKYEDLVTDHKQVMKEVCSFIDEPYTDLFEEYPESSALTQSRAWSGGASQVHNDSVSRWRKDIHKNVVDRLMSREKARGLMSHYGYL